MIKKGVRQLKVRHPEKVVKTKSPWKKLRFIGNSISKLNSHDIPTIVHVKKQVEHDRDLYDRSYMYETTDLDEMDEYEYDAQYELSITMRELEDYALEMDELYWYHNGLEQYVTDEDRSYPYMDNTFMNNGRNG